MIKGKWALILFFLVAVCTGPLAQTFKVLTAKSLGNQAEVETTEGRWTFSNFGNNTIKINYLDKNSRFNEQLSDAVIRKPVYIRPSVRVAPIGHYITWPDGTHVYFTGKKIEFKIPGQEPLLLTRSFSDSLQRGFSFQLQPNERIFGTGERSLPLNRRGYRVPLYNNPWYGYITNADALNFSVPFVLSDRGYGIFFDNPSKGYLDIGKTNPNLLEYGASSGELSFYVFTGKHPQHILRSYHLLTGTQPLPPRWAMGNFMSRFGYSSEAQTKLVMQGMQRDSIPFDAVIFDLFWFGDSIKETMGNLDWVNRQAWPDPANMIKEFKQQQIHSILITEPFILKNSATYPASLGFHAIDSAGNPYTLTDFYFGKGGLLDIFRKDTRDWFFSQYKKQVSIGVSGWWGDLGEPEKHPANMYHNLGSLGFRRLFAANEVHNLYGYYWSKMLHENYRKYYPGERLFHLNRSGYAGSPRYSSFPWSGDVSRSWEGLQSQIPLIQGMCISGIPYIHSDAGGFAGGTGDAELYVRWLQFAAFTPIYRPHGTALGNLEPTVMDIPSEATLWPEPTKSLAKQAAVTRYRWLPYNYTLSYLQTTQGIPLVRPLFFLNNNDSNLFRASDQYLWGEQVMVIPVTEKGQQVKTCYIPEGSWTNFYTNQTVQGPKWIEDSLVPEHIPIWVKEGSFIPQSGMMMNTSAYYHTPLSIVYFPSPKKTSYQLYEDDGVDPDAIQKGRYNLVTFSGQQKGDQLFIRIQPGNGRFPGKPVSRKLTLTIPGNRKPAGISINGQIQPLSIITREKEQAFGIPVVLAGKTIQMVINLPRY